MRRPYLLLSALGLACSYTYTADAPRPGPGVALIAMAPMVGAEWVGPPDKTATWVALLREDREMTCFDVVVPFLSERPQPSQGGLRAEVDGIDQGVLPGVLTPCSAEGPCLPADSPLLSRATSFDGQISHAAQRGCLANLPVARQTIGVARYGAFSWRIRFSLDR